SAVAQAVQREYAIPVQTTFGPSGVLRERIEKGEPVDVFASANMEHPQLLTKDGRSGPTVLFARNAICGITRPDVGLTSANMLERMLDPTVKLATSTPQADPAGDYAWDIFRKADGIKPGSYRILDAKAQKLVGGATLTPEAQAVPQGRN